MLWKYDAELAHRDPTVPSLALLLDETAFKQKLNHELPHLGIKNLSAHYVRYKPRTSCLVAYKVEAEKAQFNLYAKGMRLDSTNKLDKANQRINGSGERNLGLIIDDAGVVVYVFPEDRDVGVLPRLAETHSRREMLESVLEHRPDLWNAELHMLRYKPERRYVAQMVTSNSDCALLKAYAGNDYQSAQRGGKVFNSRDYLKVANRVGRSNRHKLVILEWLDGNLLSEALQEPSFRMSHMRHVGAALVELHSQRPRRLREVVLDAELQSLQSTASDLIFLCPSQSKAITKLAEQLVSDLSETKKLYYSIHNDFSADQVLLTNGHVAVLDLDAATRGDRYSDLSSFVAGIEYTVLVGDPPVIFSSEAIDAFLDGYCESSGKRLPSSLNRKIAASLLRLAPQPFRYRLSDWPRLTERIIERAVSLCNRKFKLGQWLSLSQPSAE